MAILCLESGGTKLIAAVADSKGQLSDRSQFYREQSQQAPQTLRQLAAAGIELTEAGTVEAVGFGFGGTVRRSDGRPLFCFHEKGWDTIDARRYLEDVFEAPVFVENDCNLAALAEAHARGEPSTGTLLYLTIGTGIGAGIVYNGELLRLGNLGEAEIGHTVVEPEGPACPCGNRGCLETLCSGPGLSNLSLLVLGQKMEAPQLMDAFAKGEEPARRVVEQAATYLARVLGPAVNLINPDRIVLGGGVMKSNPIFLDLISRHLEALIFPPFRPTQPFMALSRLEDDVVCQGAALYARQQLEALRSQME